MGVKSKNKSSILRSEKYFSTCDKKLENIEVIRNAQIQTNVFSTWHKVDSELRLFPSTLANNHQTINLKGLRCPSPAVDVNDVYGPM